MKMKLRRILSVFLAVITAGSLCTISVYAISAEEIQADLDTQALIVDAFGKEQLNSEVIKTVSHDLELLEKASLSKLVKINHINSDGSVTYEIPYESIGTIEYINIKEDAAGNIVLNVTDNIRHNEVVYTTDGRTLLDGYEVKYTGTSIPVRVQDPIDITPMAGHYTRTYGVPAVVDSQGRPTTPSGYNLSSSYYGPSVSLGQAIAKITVSALISSVIHHFASKAAAALGALVTAGEAGEVLNAALAYKQTDLAVLASRCTNSSSVSVGVSEYAKKGNNTIYSAWHYNITLNLGAPGYVLYTGAMRVRQST